MTVKELIALNTRAQALLDQYASPLAKIHVYQVAAPHDKHDRVLVLAWGAATLYT